MGMIGFSSRSDDDPRTEGMSGFARLLWHESCAGVSRRGGVHGFGESELAEAVDLLGGVPREDLDDGTPAPPLETYVLELLQRSLWSTSPAGGWVVEQNDLWTLDPDNTDDTLGLIRS